MRSGVVIPLPGQPIHIEALLLDVNGTLACDGVLLADVAGAVSQLGERLEVVIASGDTFGTAGAVARELGVRRDELSPGRQAEQKRALVERLGAHRTAVIGNGRNDALALARAVLGICVVGPEGCAGEAARSADVLVGSGAAALELLLHPDRLVATLRS